MAQGRVLVRQSTATDLPDRETGAGLLKTGAGLTEKVAGLLKNT